MKLIAVSIATVTLAVPTALASMVEVNDHLFSGMDSLMRTSVSSSIESFRKLSTTHANRNLQTVDDFQLICDAFEYSGDFQCTCDTSTFTATCKASDLCDQGSCSDLTLIAEFDSSFMLDSVKVCIESVPTSSEFPDVCVTLDVTGEVVDSCVVELKDASSSYEQCNKCEPCTDSTGLQGFDIDCSNFSNGVGFDTNGCLSSTDGSSGTTTTDLASVVQQLQTTEDASGANYVKQYLMTSLMAGGILLMVVV